MLHHQPGSGTEPRPGARAGAGPLPRAPRAALVLLALLVSATLAACDLTASMRITSSGEATVHVETFIEKDLIEGSGPTCVQVMDGILQGWMGVEGSGVAEVGDSKGLRCTLDQRVDLADRGWDGQSGSPLWQANSSTGEYVLDLPFSQGTGSGNLTTQDLKDSGLTGNVTLTVTMPGPITQASAGTVDGDTVTVTGVGALVKDLVIHAGGTRSHTVWWVVAVVVALSLASAWGARSLWRRQRSRRGRAGTVGGRRNPRTTAWPTHWPGGASGSGGDGPSV